MIIQITPATHGLEDPIFQALLGKHGPFKKSADIRFRSGSGDGFEISDRLCPSHLFETDDDTQQCLKWGIYAASDLFRSIVTPGIYGEADTYVALVRYSAKENLQLSHFVLSFMGEYNRDYDFENACPGRHSKARVSVEITACSTVEEQQTVFDTCTRAAYVDHFEYLLLNFRNTPEYHLAFSALLETVQSRYARMVSVK